MTSYGIRRNTSEVEPSAAARNKLQTYSRPLGTVAVVISAWAYIENRVKEVAEEAVTRHVGLHTIRHGQLPPGLAVPYVKRGQTIFPEGRGLCNPRMEVLFHLEIIANSHKRLLFAASPADGPTRGAVGVCAAVLSAPAATRLR